MRQYGALELEKAATLSKLRQIKINVENTVYLQEKLKREHVRLTEEKSNIGELKEALEIINIDKEAEAVRVKVRLSFIVIDDSLRRISFEWFEF